MSEEVQQAHELLSHVETSVAKVGLKMNSGKTKFMSYNFSQGVPFKTMIALPLRKSAILNTMGPGWLVAPKKTSWCVKGPLGEHAAN